MLTRGWGSPRGSGVAGWCVVWHHGSVWWNGGYRDRHWSHVTSDFTDSDQPTWYARGIWGASLTSWSYRWSARWTESGNWGVGAGVPWPLTFSINPFKRFDVWFFPMWFQICCWGSPVIFWPHILFFEPQTFYFSFSFCLSHYGHLYLVIDISISCNFLWCWVLTQSFPYAKQASLSMNHSLRMAWFFLKSNNWFKFFVSQVHHLSSLRAVFWECLFSWTETTFSCLIVWSIFCWKVALRKMYLHGH